MITNRNYIIAFLACFVLYLLPEIFINDALLYLSGGLIAGTISEFLKIDSNIIIFSIWMILIIALFSLYLTLKLKWLKYIALAWLAFMLNIIDNIFAFIPIFDLKNTEIAIVINYTLMLVEILIKSMALSWIYILGIAKFYA